MTYSNPLIEGRYAPPLWEERERERREREGGREGMREGEENDPKDCEMIQRGMAG